MRQTTFWISFSVLLSGCAGIPRPNTDLCIVNAPAHEMRCYNMEKDYDNKGNRKLDAEPQTKFIDGLGNLDKHLCLDPDSTANLKAYLRKISYRVKDFE